MKWICRTLRRMEAQDEEFESRIRALERLSGGEGWRGAAAGSSAVIVRWMGGGRTTTGIRRAWVPLSLSNLTTGDVPGIQT